ENQWRRHLARRSPSAPQTAELSGHGVAPSGDRCGHCRAEPAEGISRSAASGTPAARAAERHCPRRTGPVGCAAGSSSATGCLMARPFVPPLCLLGERFPQLSELRDRLVADTIVCDDLPSEYVRELYALPKSARIWSRTDALLIG